MLERLDARLWLTPILTTVAIIALSCASRVAWGKWPALNGLETSERAQVYSAIAGAAGGLLGFTLAALAIVFAFGRSESERLRVGTRGLVSLLLATSLLLLSTLTLALTSLAMDTTAAVNSVLATGAVAGSIGSAAGLAVSLAAFSLAVLSNQS